MTTDVIFLRRGNHFELSNGQPAEYKELPVGTYQIVPTKDGLKLFVADDLGAPGRLYGATEERAQKIVKTFLSNPSRPLGVLLSGIKGAGKTLLAKRASQILREQHGIITLLVTVPLEGPGFAHFLSHIKQPCLVFIDEMDKVYKKSQQEGLLTILDGAFSTHKCFIAVCNKKEKINEYLQDRTGRIRYHWHYERLESTVIEQYAKENLKNQEYLPGVLAAMCLVNTCTFDTLNAIVTEMNLYNARAGAVLNDLNVTISTDCRHEILVRGLGEYEGAEWKTNASYNPFTRSLKLVLPRQFPPHLKAQMDALNELEKAQKALEEAEEKLKKAKEEKKTKKSVLLDSTRNELMSHFTVRFHPMLDSTYNGGVYPWIENHLSREFVLELKPEHLVQEDHFGGAYIFQTDSYMVALQRTRFQEPEVVEYAI